MSSDGRKTKVQQTWERSFAGFGELSSSAGTILTGLSTVEDLVDAYPNADSSKSKTSGDTIDSLLRCDNSIPSAGSVTPPHQLTCDVLSVPETPHCRQTAINEGSDKEEPVHVIDESLIEISTQSEDGRDNHELSANTQQSLDLDSFLNHVVRQYGPDKESLTPPKPPKRKPGHSAHTVNPEQSAPRKRAKVTQTSRLPRDIVTVPSSPSIDAFLKGILSVTKHGVNVMESPVQSPQYRKTSSQVTRTDATWTDATRTDATTKSADYLNRSDVEQVEKIVLPDNLLAQRTHISWDGLSGDVRNENLSNPLPECLNPVCVNIRDSTNPDLCTSPSPPPTEALVEEALDSQHLIKEKITHILPTLSLADSEQTTRSQPVHSQFIESGCGMPYASQSVLSDRLSQPSIPSQVITCLDSTCTNSEDLESEGNVVWTPLSIASANQTPDIHRKVEEIMNKTGIGKLLPSTSGRVKRFVKGGLAEAASKVIKRDRSDYEICRHAVTLDTPALTCSHTSRPPFFIAIVVSTHQQVVIRCEVVNGDTDLRGECHLITNSLTLEECEVHAGDEINVYYPWRVTNHPHLGTVVLTTSYCAVTKLNGQSTDSSSEKGTLSSVLIGRKLFPCADNSKCEKYPKYKGRYAFLYQ